MQGEQGKDGKQGIQGEQGKQGIQGNDGNDGNDGKRGIQGIPGIGHSSKQSMIKNSKWIAIVGSLLGAMILFFYTPNNIYMHIALFLAVLSPCFLVTMTYYEE